MSTVTAQPRSTKRDRAKLVNLILLVVGYAATGPFVLAATALARNDGVFMLPIIVWLVGITSGIVLCRTHPWAAIRVSRYILIVIALVAIAAMLAPLFLTQVEVGPFD